MEQELQPMAGAAMAAEETTDPVSEEVKQLFQQAYQVMYEGGKMDSLIQTVKSGADVKVAVTDFITAIINSFIRDAGIEDMDILFNLGVLLLADILDTLSQAGVDVNSAVDQAGGNEIIQNTVQNVLKANPEFAKKVMADPATQEAMAGMGGGQPTMPTQGVLG